jgi:hypothetical protein
MALAGKSAPQGEYVLSTTEYCDFIT